jgi:flagellum-specific peptidoglycan hydrolase FlgJ
MISHVSRVVMVAGLVLAAATLNFVGVEASKVKKFRSYDEYTEAVADGSHVYVTAYKVC